MDLLGVASSLLVQVVAGLSVVQQVDGWRLLLLLSDLAQHVVDEPLLLVAITLAAGRRRETVPGGLQHAVTPALHL